MQCYISASLSPCYHYHLTSILRIYKDLQCCYAYLFPIFQHRSHCYDIFSYFEFLFCSALMPVSLFWLSSAPNCVANFHSNLDYLTILNAPKCVTIPAYFLLLGIPGRIFVFLFFIVTVMSCLLLCIPPRSVLVTISFPVKLSALLGYVGFSFRAHLLHLDWVEASFEVLAVHSI